MPELLRMPAIAADTGRVTLLEWAIAADAPVAENDVVATVETDKASVDVVAERDGVVVRLLVEPGAQVDVGDPIALIAATGERIGDVDAVLRELGAVNSAPTVNGERVFASPIARIMARDNGLVVGEITGTGPGGRIVRRDVERAIAAQAEPAQAEVAETKIVEPVADSPVSSGNWVDTPHSRMREAIARRLSESKQTVPHFYLRGTARVDALLALRTELIEVGDVKLSVNDFVIKAVACAHLAVPEMNVIWMPDAIRSFKDVDLAVAVATDTGLLTPVLRGVDRMSLSAIARTVRDYAARARSGQLRQHELTGGSGTVTNLGMYGTEEFAAIINPPHASILAVGAARPEPVVGPNGLIQQGSVLRVTLSVDHRAVDGVIAARWMREFLTFLGTPLKMLV
jgi:pyruvate dehydrogenase E2 component (dihydrolipoyllysine-residue acetyltransferase)